MTMISCLMVTLDRLALAKLAIRSYAEQSYADRELVIVSDGEEGYRNALMRCVEELGIAGVRVTMPVRAEDAGCAAQHFRRGRARQNHVQWDDDNYSHPKGSPSGRHMIAQAPAHRFLQITCITSSQRPPVVD